jgi:Cu+-exporting ATPase
MAMDPVCGMDVGESQAAGKSEVAGKTYYFCSVECQEQFEDDPESYVEEFDSGGEAERKTA